MKYHGGCLTSLACPVQTYIRPKASGKELLLVTRITVAVFGMFTGVVSIILFVVSFLCPAQTKNVALSFKGMVRQQSCPRSCMQEADLASHSQIPGAVNQPFVPCSV